MTELERYKYDVLVIGAGGGGGSKALLAPVGGHRLVGAADLVGRATRLLLVAAPLGVVVSDAVVAEDHLASRLVPMLFRLP